MTHSTFQVEQMGINLRHWDDDNALVKLNYVTSQFFECSNAENILSELLAVLKTNLGQIQIGKYLIDCKNIKMNWSILSY